MRHKFDVCPVAPARRDEHAPEFCSGSPCATSKKYRKLLQNDKL
jgi:hypothetical protein